MFYKADIIRGVNDICEIIFPGLIGSFYDDKIGGVLFYIKDIIFIGFMPIYKDNSKAYKDG